MTDYSSNLPDFPLFRNLEQYANKQNGIAIDDSRMNRSFTYHELVHAVSFLKNKLLKGKSSLKEERVAILCPSGFPYVVTLLAVWAAGGIAVPLCTTHPVPEQVYTLQDSQASSIIGHPLFANRLEELKEASELTVNINSDDDFISFTTAELQKEPASSSNSVDFESGALIIYTSGTTGKPKGAVTTHAIIDAQTSVLVDAWHWTSDDRIHHILPLHHIHGIVNALLCALYSGATCEMHQKFDSKQVWERWANSSKGSPRLTTFMSVPTVYSKLYQYYKAQDSETQKLYSDACQQFRFQVSGSASLPTTLRNDWERISGGQVLLERYGMTEIGMGLSQGYEVSERIQGTVGFPLPGVHARIISAETGEDITESRNTPGMLQIKGSTVFKEYFNRPEATQKEFTKDGWFITGDVAQRVDKPGYYQIMGRNSIDIIKTGGEKVSALEIEREILSTDLGVIDVAVVGVPDPEWGQKVAAVIVLESDKELDLLTLRNTLKKQVAVYKVPNLLKVVPALPKNAMGKVTKKELISLFQ